VPRRQIRYGPLSVQKALGALPVVAEFCRRFDIAGIVDRACPVREIPYAAHGQVIEALVADRLTSPTPLVHVLNDDHIGRALDAVAPELAGIGGSIGAKAITGLGVDVGRVDVGRIHWDMTTGQSLWRLPLSRARLHRTPLRAPEGSPPGPVGSPGRPHGQC